MLSLRDNLHFSKGNSKFIFKAVKFLQMGDR
jgi:hypothetical protein